MKVVINKQYGGFSLSKESVIRLREMGHEMALKHPVYIGEKFDDGSVLQNDNFDGYLREIPRNDPMLIQVIEEMGDSANGFCATLRIIEIPDDVDFDVEEYDGLEWIAEKRRTWG